MPDLSQTIGTFDSVSGPMDARLWIDQLETTARIHCWPEAFLYESAGLNLRGAARSWFLAMKGCFANWQQFRAAFKKTFIPEMSRAEAWNAMKLRRQGVEEKIPTYFYDKLRLCKVLCLSLLEFLEQLTMGLRSRELASHVLSKVPVGVDDLLHSMTAYQRTMDVFDHARSKAVPSWIPKDRPVYKPSGYDSRGSKGTQGTRNPGMRSVKCYNCGKDGHFANKCDQVRREVNFRNCGKTGHRQNECSRPTPLPKQEMKTITAQRGREAGRKYQKLVEISGVQVSAMIDAGSDTCTLMASTVLNAGFE